MDRRLLGVCCLLMLIAISGCASMVGGGATETVTPAPVPESAVETVTGTTTGTPTPETATESPAGRSSDPQPRYLSLRPNCERPPGMVIHIQVMALANNDVDPDEGINTTYQFSSGSRERVKPPGRFTLGIRRSYSPLLAAEQVSYGPLRRSGRTASRNVTVETNTAVTTYNWIVRQRTRGQRAGCWQTTRVIRTATSTPR